MASQTLEDSQYALRKEYALNYSRIPTLISGIFLNQEALGTPNPKIYRSLKGTLKDPLETPLKGYIGVSGKLRVGLKAPGAFGYLRA